MYCGNDGLEKWFEKCISFYLEVLETMQFV